MSKIIEEEPRPPLGGRGDTDWEAYVAQMKAAPGKWHNTGDFSPGIAVDIRRGEYSAFLDPESTSDPEDQMTDHWEVTARRNGNPSQRVDVFIRYIGR